MTLAEMEQLARDGLEGATKHVGHWQDVLAFVGKLQANPLVNIMEATVGGPLSADAMAILNGIASLTKQARPVPAADYSGHVPAEDPAPVLLAERLPQDADPGEADLGHQGQL